jgi:hypothetical protein
MKSFKQYLEEEVWGAKKTDWFVFNFGVKHLPFTTKMIDRVFGKSKKIKALHFTDLEGLKSLIKIQGTKKQISVLTDTDDLNFHQALKMGIGNEGGILVQLEGVPIMEFPVDVFSKVDEAGRRWVPLKNFKGLDSVSAKFEIDDLTRKIYDKYKDQFDYDATIREFEDLKILADKKLKAQIIKDWFDQIEIFMVKHAKELSNLNIDSNSVVDYNEVLMNKIKIKSFHYFLKRIANIELLNKLKKKFKSKQIPDDINRSDFYKIYTDWLK